MASVRQPRVHDWSGDGGLYRRMGSAALRSQRRRPNPRLGVLMRKQIPSLAARARVPYLPRLRIGFTPSGKSTTIAPESADELRSGSTQKSSRDRKAVG